jgi:uncharacterized RDD family membrane protein YckC
MTSERPGSPDPLEPPGSTPPPDPGADTAPYAPPPPSEPPPSASAPPPVVPPPPPGSAPGVGWATPVVARQEVAPGLVFSDTVSRFVAYLVDVILISILVGILAELFGWGPREVPFAQGVGTLDQAFDVSLEYTIASVVIGGLYFIASWSGGRRATLGQRLFGIQVGNAFDGKPLRLDQAVRRWLAFGDFAQVFGIVPAISLAISSLVLLWNVALLITTATSPTKQGLHDRFANSAVVRPATAGTGLAYGCLAILVALLVVAIVAIVALIFLGGQVSSILSEVGESI